VNAHSGVLSEVWLVNSCPILSPLPNPLGNRVLRCSSTDIPVGVPEGEGAEGSTLPEGKGAEGSTLPEGKGAEGSTLPEGKGAEGSTLPEGEGAEGSTLPEGKVAGEGTFPWGEGPGIFPEKKESGSRCLTEAVKNGR
jgi:hypothetical protein